VVVRSPHLALVREVRTVADLRGRSRVVAVLDVERMDPSLPACEEADDESHLHDLGWCEVGVELFPEKVIGRARIPRDRVRVPERDALAFREERRALVFVEGVVALFLDGLLVGLFLFGPNRALRSSIHAVERRRDAHPQKLLQLVLDDPLLEGRQPHRVEALHGLGDVRQHELDFGPGSSDPARALDGCDDVRIVEGLLIDVRDPRHADSS
jgi:hypothetical protein